MQSSYSSRKSGNIGKVKEKMLVTKMVSILTPTKEQLRVGGIQGISFENILIFLATVSNIEVPYKEDAKDDIEFNIFTDGKHTQSNQDSEESSNAQTPIIEMKMSQTKLLNLLPRNKQTKYQIAKKSKQRYGTFNSKGTIFFTEEEKDRIRKEFIVFSSNRREQISVINKLRVEEKKNKVLNEFDYVPKINKSCKKNLLP